MERIRSKHAFELLADYTRVGEYEQHAKHHKFVTATNSIKALMQISYVGGPEATNEIDTEDFLQRDGLNCGQKALPQQGSVWLKYVPTAAVNFMVRRRALRRSTGRGGIVNYVVDKIAESIIEYRT
ncbi:hypothetical protein G7046_g6769 [Stylonectria norvegica]|nr:hypothetical protein G7046_g6769 [Stylonectria norvegica]